MKRFRTKIAWPPLVVAVILSAVPMATCQVPPSDAPARSALGRLAGSAAGPALDQALEAIAMTRADLSFRTDYADEPDSFRISAVDLLLEDPLETETYVAGLADTICASFSLEEIMLTCAEMLDLEPGAMDYAEFDSGDTAGVAHGAYAHPEPKSMGPQALDVLLPAAREATRLMDVAFAGLNEDQRRFLALNAAVLLTEEEFDPDKPIDVRDREAQEEETLGNELLRVAGRVDYQAIADAGIVVARAVDAAVRIAAADPTSLPSRHPGQPADAFESDLVSGDVLNVLDTDVGVVILGGPGRTIYHGGAAIIIDVGGDDTYERDAAAAHRDMPVSVVIDLSGNDDYRCGPHALGAGFMGVGVLVDVAGDDIYSAGSFSLGSGLFGVGALLDRAGNDSYAGDTCVEGSGAFGIGVIEDEMGNDSYAGALFCQAFGFVEGAGILRDGGGNDVYFAGGKYTDEIRYFDHFLSLSQGFGFGWRPDASGGMGILIDESGNDVYVSDIFGQGASYWFAVGGLVDYAGNDQYVSYQYAQGAATHITCAALIDCDGDDNYVSKGVSQGCGHDLAIGLLHDLAGDDNYTCHDLSQAAGNANGIGALFDDAGDDSYSVRNPDNTHGYGNLRRDYGSVGVFIDCSGSDAYTGRGSDGGWWSYSDYGIGLDIEAGKAGDEE